MRLAGQLIISYLYIKSVHPFLESLTRCYRRAKPNYLMNMERSCCTVGDTVHLPGGITSIDYTFTLPLRWLDSDIVVNGTVEVFAREIFHTRIGKSCNLPYLLYLQGGPGYPSPRFTGSGGWIGYALEYYRIILLDQRGTGKSSPITSASLGLKGNAKNQAEYLEHFRADSIVKDSEVIRRYFESTCGDLTTDDQQMLKWTVLGQSYGGFCITTYLSLFPESIEAAIFTGGLPPLRSIDEVYRATYCRLAERNRRYYKRYPKDIIKVREIVRYLADSPNHGVPLPGGGLLTPRRFLQLGLKLGMTQGFEELHYLVDEAWEQNWPGSSLSFIFLSGVEYALGFETNPIYALLHEPIYMYNGLEQASGWSAQRVLIEGGPSLDFRFNWEKVLEKESGIPIYFTGEMVYPWMFEGDYKRLEPYREVANLLAEKKNWPKLYDVEKLRECEVPCAAAIYYDDMYVEREFSEELATILPNCKVWVTNEYQHSGLRDDGVEIFKKLVCMIRDEVNIPS